MASDSRRYPYEKSIILGALYDTIEALGLRLDSSNSARGTLIVSDAEQTGKLRIALGVGASTAQTQVEVFQEDADSAFAESWRPVILDELDGMIQRCVTPRRERER